MSACIDGLPENFFRTRYREDGNVLAKRFPGPVNFAFDIGPRGLQELRPFSASVFLRFVHHLRSALASFLNQGSGFRLRVLELVRGTFLRQFEI